MNSFENLPTTRCLLNALLTAVGLVTGGQAMATTLTPNLLGTPNDGVACRTGYVASFNGSTLKCLKSGEIRVDLTCADPAFPNKVVRASAPGTPNGLDVCDKPGGVTITSANNISAFVQGSDYVFAKKDDAQIASRTASQNQAEATALGLPANEVETVAAPAVTDTTSGDSTDKSVVRLTFFTYPVRTTGLAGAPVATPPTAFVPRPLSR